MSNCFNFLSLKISSIVLTFSLLSCTEDEIVEPIAPTPPTEQLQNEEEFVSSLTVSGIFSLSEANVDCRTCTYVIPESTKLIDGAALEFKPGAVICLDKALKYGDLEFINLPEEVENPITIANTTFPAK